MTRYAIYFAPARQSVWWQRGCEWLGRDAETGASHDLPPIAGVPAAVHRQLTHNARRYGFHATLKAPFYLAPGFDEGHLLSMAQAFARCQSSIHLPPLEVSSIGAFLALQPVVSNTTSAASLVAINALASRCVSYFDILRAPQSAAELERRRRGGLTARLDTLLKRWGYPYTEEAFRFHMTLTDALTGVETEAAGATRAAAEAWFIPARIAPLQIDSLAVFREANAGANFELVARFAFSSAGDQIPPMLPAPGKLFFIVGPYGAGKNSLLRWVSAQLPASSNLSFARCTIALSAEASEDNEVIDSAAFWQAAGAGQFAMLWQANNLCFGVRRGIEADLRAGLDVVINGSLEYVAQLRQSHPQAQVIWIESSIDQIRRRMVERRRESRPALLRRLNRSAQFSAYIDGDIVRLNNTGTLEDVGSRLMALLSTP